MKMYSDLRSDGAFVDMRDEGELDTVDLPEGGSDEGEYRNPCVRRW
jgi:hypothetical protein